MNGEEQNKSAEMNFSGWGRFSETFLTKITDDINGENLSIMDMLWRTNLNLMKLLSVNYKYAEKSSQYRRKKFSVSVK